MLVVPGEEALMLMVELLFPGDGEVSSDFIGIIGGLETTKVMSEVRIVDML